MEYQKNLGATSARVKPSADNGETSSGPSSAVKVGSARAHAVIATHTIKEGDTLSRIAEKYYGKGHSESWRDIVDFNPGLKPGKLKLGKTIEIPQLPEDEKAPVAASPGTYTVQSGDTLTGIAKKVYNRASRWTEIQKANPEINSANLKQGQVLKIPELKDIDQKSERESGSIVSKSTKQGVDTRQTLSIAERVLSNLSGDEKKMLKVKLALRQGSSQEYAFNELASSADITLTPEGISDFQIRRGLKVTGAIDNKTASGMYQEISYMLYKNSVLQNPKYVWVTIPEKIQIVGLRGFNVKSGVNENAFNEWNDSLAICWLDKKGRARVKEFVATTDPGIKKGSERAGTPDVDGDGKRDAAHMSPGQYLYRPGSHRGHYGALRPVSKVNVFRDTDQDGNISSEEEEESIERGDTSIDCDIHGGARTKHPNGISAGCQVPQITWSEFHQQFSTLYMKADHKTPTQNIIYYTLIDCTKQ